MTATPSILRSLCQGARARVWTDADATAVDEVGMGVAADGVAHISLDASYAPADDDAMETERARAPPPPLLPLALLALLGLF